MAASETETRLAGVPLFSGMSSRQLKRLIGAAKEVRHPAGREVTEQDKGALAFHLVLAGEASVAVGGTVRRQLGPGDHFGEISMIDGRPRSATVTAVTDLTTLVVPHDAFQKVLDDDPAVARQLLVLLCARLREAESTG